MLSYGQVEIFMYATGYFSLTIKIATISYQLRLYLVFFFFSDAMRRQLPGV